MSDTKLPVLYSFRRCPYAMRARMALLASGQHCELREVVLRSKPDEMIAASPKATVPVLVDVDGKILDESMLIMHWALSRHDPDNWLSPSSGSTEEMHALISRIDGPFKEHLDRYKYWNRYNDDTCTRRLTRNGHRDAAIKILTELSEQLRDHQFLFGANLSLADVAIAPFVRQYANTDANWFSDQPVPELQNWLGRIIGSDLFLACMQKYDQWQNTSPVILFPPYPIQDNKADKVSP
jgi:glutathione S-transferase